MLLPRERCCSTPETFYLLGMSRLLRLLNTIMAPLKNRIAPPTLLTLPAEIRNNIYAYALCDPVHLTAINPSLDMPPLTHTCRQTLQESLGIFLSDTQLVAHIIDYDGAFVGHIYSRRLRLEAILDAFTGPPFQQPFGYSRDLNLVVTGKPNYANLLRWAQVMHRQGWQPFEGAEGDRSEDQVYSAVLGTAARLKNLPWSRVEEILEGMHVAFAALDPRWA